MFLGCRTGILQNPMAKGSASQRLFNVFQRGKSYRKPSFFQWNMVMSCRFSLQPFHFRNVLRTDAERRIATQGAARDDGRNMAICNLNVSTVSRPHQKISEGTLFGTFIAKKGQTRQGGFHKWRCPNSWTVYFMENPSIDDLGYPYLENPSWC